MIPLEFVRAHSLAMCDLERPRFLTASAFWNFELWWRLSGFFTVLVSILSLLGAVVLHW